jgi:hypothetical protein
MQSTDTFPPGMLKRRDRARRIVTMGAVKQGSSVGNGRNPEYWKTSNIYRPSSSRKGTNL